MALIENATPAFRHVAHRISDPDAFGLALPGTEMMVDFLLPQRHSAHVEQFQTVNWSLGIYDMNVKARIRGPIPPGWGCVGLGLSLSPSQWHGLAASRGVFICTPPGDPFDGQILPGFSCGSVYAAPHVWERCRRLSGAERATYGGTAAVRLTPPVFANVERRLLATMQLLRAAHADPRIAPPALEQAASFVSSVITIAWECSTPEWQPCESLRNRSRLARRAEAWMQEHLAEPFQVPDVCLALRVSRRELEYAFRAAFDQSPHDHLQTLRLNAVYRVLSRSRDPDETVSRVAMERGITHLGRFSTKYRALFGESPSATLRS
jgi:AraC-like DNA-binding protein